MCDRPSSTSPMDTDAPPPVWTDYFREMARTALPPLVIASPEPIDPTPSSAPASSLESPLSGDLDGFIVHAPSEPVAVDWNHFLSFVCAPENVRRRARVLDLICAGRPSTAAASDGPLCAPGSRASGRGDTEPDRDLARRRSAAVLLVGARAVRADSARRRDAARGLGAGTAAVRSTAASAAAASTDDPASVSGGECVLGTPDRPSESATLAVVASEPSLQTSAYTRSGLYLVGSAREALAPRQSGRSAGRRRHRESRACPRQSAQLIFAAARLPRQLHHRCPRSRRLSREACVGLLLPVG